MRLLHLYEEALPRELIRAVKEWSALWPSDRDNGRRSYVTGKLLAAASILQATKTTSLGPLFRGIHLSKPEWHKLVEMGDPITVNWGMLSSWTTNASTGTGFMEVQSQSVLLEHNFPYSEILFYAPDLWNNVPTNGSPPAAVHEEEAVVYHSSGKFTIQPNMIVDRYDPD